jgi:acylphosphatase
MMREPAQEPGSLEENVSLEVRVSGRVQGVGFRYFAHEAARRLGLVGYVTNLRTGGVRAYAEGSRQALAEFLCQMEKGPAGSCVRETQSHWGPATGQYSFFSIERTI